MSCSAARVSQFVLCAFFALFLSDSIVVLVHWHLRIVTAAAAPVVVQHVHAFYRIQLHRTAFSFSWRIFIFCIFFCYFRSSLLFRHWIYDVVDIVHNQHSLHNIYFCPCIWTLLLFIIGHCHCEDNDADEISRVERNERKTAVVAKVRNAKQRESKNGERATRRGRKWFLRFEIFRVEFICIAIVWRYCMDGNNEITKCWVHWHRSVAMHLTPCASHASSVPHTLKYPARCLDA